MKERAVAIAWVLFWLAAYSGFWVFVSNVPVPTGY